MQEFASKRKEIIRESRKEKQRLGRDMRRDQREYKLKLERDNKELYQKFKIRTSMRAYSGDRSELEQIRARREAWLKITKQMRKQRRAAERAIERQRDEQIKVMRDSLRAQPTQASDSPQIFNIADYQRGRQSSGSSQRRAA